MPRCFWNGVCDCPTNTPINAACAPCHGYFCSLLNGTLITAETQIQDPFTDQVIQAITNMDRDAATINRIRAEVEREKAEIEREQQELQQKINNASNYTER